MVGKTFTLSKEDQEYLVSIICRYRATQTSIDEETGQLTVWTTFADNKEPTSIAARFNMLLVSDDPPKMPDHEYRSRVLGKF
jgi:hypothetical protein